MASSDALPVAVADVLAGFAAEQGFRRPRLHVESGSNVGDGYTSTMFRVLIQDEDKSGRADALITICKTVSTGNAEGFAKPNFESEACMYNQVLPAMAELAHLTEPLPWPKCLLASATAPSCVLLPDLRAEGFAMADRTAPLDVEHCRLALRQLARFHGAGMALRALRPKAFAAAVAVFDASFSDPSLRNVWIQAFRGLMNVEESIKDRFPDEVNRKLKKIFTAFATDYFSMTKVPSDSPANGLAHGDCTLNNFMFQYDQGGAVVGCRLIDFQGARFGCTAWDVCTLLLPSTDRATRGAHWDGLLRGYHDELQATLRAAGIADPDAVYSWDQLQAALRAEFRLGLCIAPWMLNVSRSDDEAARREMHEMFRRLESQSGALQLAEAAVVAPRAPPMTADMKQRFGDLVQDLLDWGWL